MRMLELHYGKPANLIDHLGIRLSDFEYHRLHYLKNLIAAKKSHNAILGAGQHEHDFQSKAALFWATIAHQLTPQSFDSNLQAFYQSWKFKQPDLQKLIALCAKTTDRDIEKFVEQFAQSDRLADYAIDELTTGRHSGAPSPFESQSQVIVVDVRESSAPSGSLAPFHTSIAVSRLGELAFPAEIEVVFADGLRQRLQWDGENDAQRFGLISNSPAISATIDPEHKFSFDSNFANNSKTVAAQLGDEKLLGRWLFFLQNVAIFWSSFSG